MPCRSDDHPVCPLSPPPVLFQRDGKRYAMKIFTKAKLALLDVSGMLEEVSILWHLKVGKAGGLAAGEGRKPQSTFEHFRSSPPQPSLPLPSYRFLTTPASERDPLSRRAGR